MLRELLLRVTHYISPEELQLLDRELLKELPGNRPRSSSGANRTPNTSGEKGSERPTLHEIALRSAHSITPEDLQVFRAEAKRRR